MRAIVEDESVRTDQLPAGSGCHDRTRLRQAVAPLIRRFRPAVEAWRLSVFQSQTGAGGDLAISGPRFRKVLTLHGRADDLPGRVAAYVEAIFAHRVTAPDTRRAARR